MIGINEMSFPLSGWRRGGRGWLLRASMGALIFMIVVANAWAQESGREWKFMKLTGEIQGGYRTQQEAERAMQAQGEKYALLRFVRRAEMQEDQIRLVYWAGLDTPALQAWKYKSRFGSFNSEQEMIKAALTYFDQRSASDGCPTGAYLESSGGWSTMFAWPDGVPYRESNSLVFRFRQDNPVIPGIQCDLAKTIGESGDRSRGRCANAAMTYDHGAGVCRSFDEAYLFSTPLHCETCALVGNPADFSTGDKFETERDLDFAWISFERYYHSATSNGGPFGHGWTHNHNFRLTVGSRLGLIRPNGSHLPFRPFSGYHEATDGSGDRIVASASGWTLFQSDRTIAFDSLGRPVEQRFEDGSALSYSYDTKLGRLDAIEHSSGRALKFKYVGASADSQVASITADGKTLVAFTYGANGQLATVNYPDSGSRRYHYEDIRFPANLTGVTDENNNRFSTFSYDEKARLISSKHAGGADSTTLAYTSQGGAVVTNTLGYQSTYGLTAAGSGGLPRKAGNISDSQGVVVREYFEDDFRRRPKSLVGRKGDRTEYAYDEGTLDGKAVANETIRQAVGTSEVRTRVESRDLNSNRPVYLKIGNRETKTVRNARFQPISVTDKDIASGESRTKTFTYCEQSDVSAGVCPMVGLLIKIDGPRTDVNDITAYSYYPSDKPLCNSQGVCSYLYRKGDLWKITDSLGHVTEVLSYSLAGRASWVRDPNGMERKFAYTLRGWQNGSWKYDGDELTTIDHWPNGTIKKITDPTGAFFSFGYDAARRLTEIADQNGNTIRYTLDSAGNRRIEEARAANGAVKRTLSRVFDNLGRLVTQKDADGHPTGFTYDKNGNPETATDALLHRNVYAFDALDRIKSMLEDDSGLRSQTQFFYDAFDNVVKVVDPRGKETSFAYNAFGEVTRENGPDRKTIVNTYDSAGNLKSRVDARNVKWEYQYDALNRIRRVYTASGNLEQVWSYDECENGKRRLCAAGTLGSNALFSYDRLGNVKSRQDRIVGKEGTGVSSIYLTQYTYDSAGRMVSIDYPSGLKIGYGYATNKPVSMTATMAGVATAVVSAASYEPFGPLNGWIYGNGLKRLVGYNKDGLPAAISVDNGPFQSLTYAFDANNRVDKVTNGVSPGVTHDYDYDGLSRLREVTTGSNDTWAYTYDAAGNRSKAVLSGRSSRVDSYSVGADNNRLAAIGGGQTAAFSYDGAGNTIGAYGLALTYNGFNRLQSVGRGGAQVAAYQYNAFHERVFKTAPQGDTRFVYTPDSQLLSEHQDNGNVWTDYLWFGDELVGIMRGGQILYIHTDHLGRPEAATDGAKSVLWRANNYTFGRTLARDSIGGLNVGFPGQYYDVESGLWYNRYRYYDANTGRYLQVDPIGLGDGINPYVYVDSDPVNQIDPSGLAGKVPGSRPRSGGTTPEAKSPNLWNDYQRLVAGNGKNSTQNGSDYRQARLDYMGSGISASGSIDKLYYGDDYICARVMCFMRRNSDSCAPSDHWEQQFYVGGRPPTYFQVSYDMPGCKCERAVPVESLPVPEADVYDVMELWRLHLANMSRARRISR